MCTLHYLHQLKIFHGRRWYQHHIDDLELNIVSPSLSKSPFIILRKLKLKVCKPWEITF